MRIKHVFKLTANKYEQEILCYSYVYGIEDEINVSECSYGNVPSGHFVQVTLARGEGN